MVEAVIIEGPRKGEIVTLSDDLTEEPPPEQILEALNAALKELDAAVVAAIEETRAWRREMQEAIKKNHG